MLCSDRGNAQQCLHVWVPNSPEFAALLGKLHARHNGHSHEFLEEKFAGIRQEHLNNAGGALACWAMELVLTQVGHCHDTALLAHMHPVRIALVEEPLLQPAKQWYLVSGLHNLSIEGQYTPGTICVTLQITVRSPYWIQDVQNSLTSVTILLPWQWRRERDSH